ncbi:tumor protein p53-inducible nuclear protein 2-like [Oncorhynchus clarkii lewisi]|uniref:tumor protein p53-inducible nuclear protein 2-like n=1 Tax=Oncorhynchus clarkii lewisi TaxID=490388 RepID=UPI0039B82204
MFRRLTSLFFGRDEDIPTDQRTSKPAEMLEEGWFLVNHQEAINEVSSVEEPVVECANTSIYRCPSNLTVTGESEPISETDVSMSEPELPVQRSATSPSRIIRESVSMAGQLAKVTQVARVQRAQTRVDRRHLTRSCIQRQNSVCLRAQRHSSRTTYLQQPGHRNFSH